MLLNPNLQSSKPQSPQLTMQNSNIDYKKFLFKKSILVLDFANLVFMKSIAISYEIVESSKFNVIHHMSYDIQF
jgi:hypothetical protein